MGRFIKIILIVLSELIVFGCNSSSVLPSKIECAGIRLIRIPEGSRVIGTNYSRANRREKPACVFVLDYPVFMSSTEITERQYREVTGIEEPNYAADYPMCCSWPDAMRFCEKYEKILRTQTDRDWFVRLPTEAEWEYAACYGRPPGEDWWPSYMMDDTGYDIRDHAWYCDTSKGAPHHPGVPPET